MLIGLLLFWMDLGVNGEDTISSFIRDMMATFQLNSPTIMYGGDEAPEICYTDQWVLCLSTQATQVPQRDPQELANDPKSDDESAEHGRFSIVHIAIIQTTKKTNHRRIRLNSQNLGHTILRN